VAVANARASLIQSQNSLHLRETALLRVLGVSQDSAVTLTDELNYNPISPDVRAAMSEALLNRPEVLSSRLSVKSQEFRVEATKAGTRPRVLFTGDYMLSKPGVGGFSLGWYDEFQAILSFEMPLFEGFETAGKLMQERALLQQFRTAVRDSEEQVLLEVTQAYLSLEDADEFVQSQRVNLEQASEGLRLAEVGFREGVRKQVEVLDARTALTEAQKNFSQAVYDHMVARLNLERATGSLAQGAAGAEGSPEK
jgi:outer membrane protein TolC